MSSKLEFAKKHWLTIVLLAGSVFVVNRVVVTQRAPGSMSVVEAQGMDMTLMKPPVGITPVSADTASEREFADGPMFPAKVVSFNDQEIAARIPGLVQKILVYPGDLVRAGQLLAELSAGEFDADRNAKSLEASALQASVAMAQRDVSHHEHLQREALAKARMAENAVERAKSDAEADALDVQKTMVETDAQRNNLAEHKANIDYQEKEFARQQKLYESRVISLAELQESEKSYKQAQAAYRGGQQNVRALEVQVEIAKKRKASSEQGVAEAINARTASRSVLAQTEDAILQAQQNVRAAKLGAQASSATAAGAGIVANYRELRAVADGVVSSREISPGTAVMPGQILLKIKSAGPLRVQAELPNQFAQKVRTGTRVRILVGDHATDTNISAVFPTANESSRTIRVEALLFSSAQGVVPGMLAKLQLLDDAAKTRLGVRKEAVLMDQDGTTFVWLIQRSETPEKASDWTCPMHPEISAKGPGICPKCKMDLVPRYASADHQVTRRTVAVGIGDGTNAEILSGLQDGDQVVWKGQGGLVEGALVNPSAIDPGETKAPPDKRIETDSSPKSEAKPAPRSKSETWTCPMHPEVQQNKPGTCPKCKMDLVKQSDTKTTPDKRVETDPSPKSKGEPAPKSKSEIWTCPMHPEVQQNKPGTCPKCKMDLVKKDGR